MGGGTEQPAEGTSKGLGSQLTQPVPSCFYVLILAERQSGIRRARRSELAQGGRPLGESGQQPGRAARFGELWASHGERKDS